jgi:DNA invertase Pin-like site-specific DNA recombinase
MALIGYARVSTGDQTTDPQTDQLTAAGCERIFAETVSGSRRERPELDALLDYIRSGDVLVIAKLDRLGRSLHHLLDTIADLDAKGIGLRSLNEGIDTTTSTGRLLLHILGAIAQFERDLIIERTNVGLSAARARGRVGGRPIALTPEKLEAARALIASGNSVVVAAKAVGVGKATLYRRLSDEIAGDPDR